MGKYKGSVLLYPPYVLLQVYDHCTYDQGKANNNQLLRIYNYETFITTQTHKGIRPTE